MYKWHEGNLAISTILYHCKKILTPGKIPLNQTKKFISASIQSQPLKPSKKPWIPIWNNFLTQFYVSTYTSHIYLIAMYTSSPASQNQTAKISKFKWQFHIPALRVFPNEVSAYIDSYCIPTAVAQRYPYLSKFSDHALNDKALRTYNTFTFDSQHCPCSELLFLTAQPAALLRKINIGTSTKSQSVSYAKVSLTAKVYEKTSGLNMLTLNQLNFKKRFILPNKMKN